VHIQQTSCITSEAVCQEQILFRKSHVFTTARSGHIAIAMQIRPRIDAITEVRNGSHIGALSDKDSQADRAATQAQACSPCLQQTMILLYVLVGPVPVKLD